MHDVELLDFTRFDCPSLDLLGKSHMSKFTILQVTIKLLQWSDEILTIARCPGV